ncbi:MAG: type II toxin-antitoxin system PemK/MazF family toxin [Novosphingobium sp.]
MVLVPFPFVEAPRLRKRPAVVISVQQPATGIDLLWVLMVTSASNKGWRGDVSLETRHGECRLEVPCVVRTAKIATVESARAEHRGAMPADLFADVRKTLLGCFAESDRSEFP